MLKFHTNDNKARNSRKRPEHGAVGLEELLAFSRDRDKDVNRTG